MEIGFRPWQLSQYNWFWCGWQYLGNAIGRNFKFISCRFLTPTNSINKIGEGTVQSWANQRVLCKTHHLRFSCPFCGILSRIRGTKFVTVCPEKSALSSAWFLRFAAHSGNKVSRTHSTRGQTCFYWATRRWWLVFPPISSVLEFSDKESFCPFSGFSPQALWLLLITEIHTNLWLLRITESHSAESTPGCTTPSFLRKFYIRISRSCPCQVKTSRPAF